MRIHCSPGSRGSSLHPACLLALALAMISAGAAVAQDASTDQGITKGGFLIHQSVDLGGRVDYQAGSGAMYDTLVNLQSGPRVLNHFLTIHATGKPKFHLFDDLTTASAGYGGDPNNFTTLSMSKGKLYDFRGSFRRDRQYFDYNLLGNPLIPAGLTSNGYTFPQVLDAPHLFNTVRRMTDVSLTLFPISKVHLRFGYSQNVSQGPSYSSVHFGTEALLYQAWRNSTDTWLAGADWKPFSKTTLTYEEQLTHYKGDTSWRLAALNLQLTNSTPVSLGFDNVTVPSCTGGAPISSSSTTPPTANAACNGYLQYTRSEPTRTLFPTESFRFQSSDIRSLRLNGDVRYTGATMNMPSFNEYFNGLESRTTLRASTITGFAKAQRINVSAALGAVWEFSDKVSFAEQYNFDDFRQPGITYLSEVDQAGSSMLSAPGAPGTATVTSGSTFLGMKTHTNTITGMWDASARLSLSLAYRYRSRLINRSMPLTTDALPTGTAYTLNLHENGGILGLDLRPTRQWKISSSIEATYADNTYTQLSPRALQHYQVRTTYKPRPWATLSGAFNDLERRNNVLYVGHLDHSRSASVSASLAPNAHFSLDLSYGYLDVFSRTGLCYVATPTPTGATSVPAGTKCGSNTLLGTGYYDAPSQYGAMGLVWTPVKTLRTAAGYRANGVYGTIEFLNPRNVAGSLQSQFHTPYGSLDWTIAKGWAWKADWNYYAYGEATAIGPTLPRSFHSNLLTLAVHHEF